MTVRRPTSLASAVPTGVPLYVTVSPLITPTSAPVPVIVIRRVLL